MEKFNDYVNESLAASKNLPKDWVLNEFTVRDWQRLGKRKIFFISDEALNSNFYFVCFFFAKKKMHQIMLNVVHAVRFKLQRKTGYFGIYGYDFMIDENMKTYLIEINVNPAITCNTDVLYAAIPPAISEGIRK